MPLEVENVGRDVGILRPSLDGVNVNAIHRARVFFFARLLFSHKFSPHLPPSVRDKSGEVIFANESKSCIAQSGDPVYFLLLTPLDSTRHWRFLMH